MDSVVAGRLERELSGTELGGWAMHECIGYGKSALVFRATREADTAAVKVFDRELVEKFGKDSQRERVSRERSLVGKSHPNLIQILDAGEDTRKDLFFVAMAFFPGKNLAQALPTIPFERVPQLIAQIASAARFLERLRLAHRDIKPENIGISDDFSTAVLLDLGVLRPIGFSTITDQPGQQTFVGTLQYSPPELLKREEEDSESGWRAITFYQLGGVLHDLITRTPLFAEHLTPYARLVEAVSHTTPSIHAPGVPPELRMLAQDCLVKDPTQRLSLVSWSRFDWVPGSASGLEAAKARIEQRRQRAALTMPTHPPTRSIFYQEATGRLRETLERGLRDGCKQVDMPPFTVHTDEGDSANVHIVFSPSIRHALAQPFCVCIEGMIRDVPELISDVWAIGISGSDRMPVEGAPLACKVSVFSGVLTDDILMARLATLLLYFLDAAQEAESTRSINHPLLEIGECTVTAA